MKEIETKVLKNYDILAVKNLEEYKKELRKIAKQEVFDEISNLPTFDEGVNTYVNWKDIENLFQIKNS